MIFVYYILSLISGFIVTLQVGVNGSLRSKLNNPLLASLISFAVGTLALALIFFSAAIKDSNNISSLGQIKNASLWMFTGGLLGAFYVFATVIIPAKIGFANMFCLVICGQLLLAVIFDHFGLLGNKIHLLTPLRALGIVLLIIGAYIIQTN